MTLAPRSPAPAPRQGPSRTATGFAPVRVALCPTHHRAARAFTLVELLVVLAIGGLLLAVTPPLITAALPGVELKAAARRTAGSLRLAREIAIAQGRDAAWVIDVEQHRYSIEAEQRSGSLPGGIDIELVAAEEEMQSEHVGAIRFYPDGSSSGGRVILKRGDAGFQVGVNWLTGRILIAEWER